MSHPYYGFMPFCKSTFFNLGGVRLLVFCNKGAAHNFKTLQMRKINMYFAFQARVSKGKALLSGNFTESDFFQSTNNAIKLSDATSEVRSRGRNTRCGDIVGVGTCDNFGALNGCNFKNTGYNCITLSHPN